MNKVTLTHRFGLLSVFFTVFLAAGLGFSQKTGAATVSVNPGDNVKAKVEGANSGDVVQFSEGRWAGVNDVYPKSGVRVKGVRGKTFIVSDNDRFAFWVDNGRIGTFEDLNFDGSGISGKGRATIFADWCHFTNFQRGVNVGFGSGTGLGNHNNGLHLSGKVTNCSFTGGSSGGGWGIGFFTHTDLTIADCEFINIANGIKSNNAGATGHKLLITRNYFSGISRMEAELQGMAYDFELSDNYVENPVFPGGSNFQGNIHKLGFSVIYHGTTDKDANGVPRQGNCRILRNTMIVPQRPDGTGMRLNFEHGNGFVVEFNYMRGGGTFASCYMGFSGGGEPRESQIGTSDIRNNQLVDVRWGQGSSYGTWGRNARFSNNNPNVQLPWDLNRGRPGPGRSWGQPPPATQPTPIPDPTPVPTWKPIVTLTGDTTVTVSYAGVTGANSYVMNVKTSDGPDFPVRFTTPLTSIKLKDLHWAWEYTFWVEVGSTKSGETRIRIGPFDPVKAGDGSRWVPTIDDGIPVPPDPDPIPLPIPGAGTDYHVIIESEADIIGGKINNARIRGATATSKPATSNP